MTDAAPPVMTRIQQKNRDLILQAALEASGFYFYAPH